MTRSKTHLVRYLPPALALAGALCTASAHAAENWGTMAEVYTLNCTSADCSGGATSSGGSSFPPDDEVYQGSPATNSISDVRGDATMTAAFETPVPGLATMKQTGSATGGATGVAFGIGHTLDLVTYSGPPTTLTINVDLTGEHTGPDSGADNSLDGLRGRVYLFTNENAINSIGGSGSPRLNCLFECYSPDDSVTVEIQQSDLADTAALTVSLDNGDEFYLYGVFNVTGAGGGSAISLDSFTYSFSSTAGLTSLAGGGVAPTDSDADGIPDSADNCTQVPNPAQVDADGDGYGNFCDADLNNDLIVNVEDLGALRQAFFSSDPVADFNSDGTVNVLELGILRAAFFLPPGPSGIAP